MKHLILIPCVIAALSLSACGEKEQKSIEKTQLPAVNVVQSKVSDARLTAVMVYADWCGSCKILDPKVENIKATIQFEETAFVTLDYTQKNTDAFFADARASDVEKAVRDYLGDKVKTGQLLLVDMDDQKVIDVIKKDKTNDEIIETIKQAASGA